MTRSSHGLDARRRRALYRAWHRGTREMDLLLGTFADAYIAALDTADLLAFEALLDVGDPELLVWLTGQAEVAAPHDTAVYRAIRNFHATRHKQDGGSDGAR
jgi:antitoxin CptB